MVVKIARIPVMVLALVAAACGGKPSSPAPEPAPAAPVLTMIEITPDTFTLYPGEHVDFAATGTFSDGSTHPVAPSWFTSHSTLASIAPTDEPEEIRLTALALGAVTLTATLDGMNATAEVLISMSEPSASTVYGYHDNGTVIMQEEGGGAQVELGVVPGEFWPTGIALKQDGTKLYFVTSNPLAIGGAILGLDLVTNAWTEIATLPGDRPMGLDIDGAGLLYTAYYAGTGEITRIDPVTGSTEVVGSMGGCDDIAVTSLGTVFGGVVYGMGGGSWLLRYDSFFGWADTWATTPNAVMWGAGDMWIIGGIACNVAGEVFIVECVSPQVYRYVDTNSDGDALDAGERNLYASIPAGVEFSSVRQGLTSTRGRSVMLNVAAYESPDFQGMHWLADLNDDGDAQDAGEVVIWNPAGLAPQMQNWADYLGARK